MYVTCSSTKSLYLLKVFLKKYWAKGSRVGAGLAQCWRRVGAGLAQGWRRVGAVVRALAFHQCVPGSIPGIGIISGLSLLVLYSAPRGFSLGTPVFPSLQKPTFDLICVDLQSPQLVEHLRSARKIWDLNKVIIMLLLNWNLRRGW